MSNETGHERLWTPWRMRYVAGNAKEEGCIFCNRVHAHDDVSSLILHRDQHCFVIMNLYPYNTGHIMIVPNQHADDLDQLDAATLHEMADVLPIATRALRRVLSCQGFNVGLNIGSVAGAGVAEHLHQHVVPRWVGDANFMPIIASTTVMPELIPASYAKIRAELHRELSEDPDCMLLILVDDDTKIVMAKGALPTCSAAQDQSIWKAAMSAIGGWATEIEIAGWAGPTSASQSAAQDAASGLALRAHIGNCDLLPGEMTLVRFDEVISAPLSIQDRAIIENGILHLTPGIARPVEGGESGF